MSTDKWNKGRWLLLSHFWPLFEVVFSKVDGVVAKIGSSLKQTTLTKFNQVKIVKIVTSIVYEKTKKLARIIKVKQMCSYFIEIVYFLPFTQSIDGIVGRNGDKKSKK